MWVAETMMLASGMPVALLARSRIMAVDFAETWMISMTTNARTVSPSSATKARAYSGSITPSACRLLK